IHALDRLVDSRALKAVPFLRNSHTFQYQSAAVGIRLTLLILGRGQEVESWMRQAVGSATEFRPRTLADVSDEDRPGVVLCLCPIGMPDVPNLGYYLVGVGVRPGDLPKANDRFIRPGGVDSSHHDCGEHDSA